MNPSPTALKPSILLFVERYLPGYRFGGPVRAVANLAALLREDYDLFIVTRDRDVGDQRAYSDVQPDVWQKQDGYFIRYLSPQQITTWAIGRLLRERPDAMVYTNSLFSPFTRHLLALSFLTDRAVIVAPRGELHAGALRLKTYKKRPYIALIRRLFTDRIDWHATSSDEENLIKHWFPGMVRRIRVAPDLSVGLSPRPCPVKQPGRLRLIWLARIAPNKGLRFLLDCLLQVTEGEISLDIYGPVSDRRYWRDCQRLIGAVPAQHQVTYRGELPHAAVGNTLSRYDFLVLPTAGESFGYIIAESLSVGLPVLISDQTPWRNLYEQQAGYDLPLDHTRWVAILTACLRADQRSYADLVEGAVCAAKSLGDWSIALAQYRNVFTLASQPGHVEVVSLSLKPESV